ncbi:MAG: S41 family peptidase [Clostridia bacterium]|nr:S41 family peptidase [Clostridia bacterium]
MSIWKKALRGVFIACLAGTIISGCSAAPLTSNKDRLQMWQEDIDHLAVKLPEMHKNLFFKIRSQDFNDKLAQLKSSLGKMKDEEIIIEVQKIMASIGDAHTSINIGAEQMIPLEFYWFKDGFYVINAAPEYHDLLHCRLTMINGHDIRDIYGNLAEVISHENDAMLKSQMPYYLIMPGVLRPLKIIPDTTTIPFTFETRSKERVQKELKPISGSDVFKNILGKGKEGNPLPLYMKNRDQYYWYEFLENQKTVYFKYNRCDNMDTQSLKRFTNNLFDFIQNNNVEKLVIDLRDNPGGRSDLLNGFIQKLSGSKLDQKGSLYVIIGRKTFSSAILNTVEFRNRTKAVFVGESTSGKPNHYGEVRQLKLPNSQTTVKFSTKYFKQSSEDTDTFIPDRTIELSVDDYINNVDPVLESILKDPGRQGGI